MSIRNLGALGVLMSGAAWGGAPLVRNGWPLGGLERFQGVLVAPSVPPQAFQMPHALQVRWKVRPVGTLEAPVGFALHSLQVGNGQVVVGYGGLGNAEHSGAIEVLEATEGPQLFFSRQLIVTETPVLSAIDWQGDLYFISKSLPAHPGQRAPYWIGKVGSEPRGAQPTAPTALWSLTDDMPQFLYLREKALYTSLQNVDTKSDWEAPISPASIGPIVKSPSMNRWGPVDPQHVVKGPYVFIPQGQGGLKVVCGETGENVGQLNPVTLIFKGQMRVAPTRAIGVGRGLAVTSHGYGGLTLYKVFQGAPAPNPQCPPVVFQLATHWTPQDGEPYSHVEILNNRIYAGKKKGIDIFNLHGFL